MHTQLLCSAELLSRFFLESTDDISKLRVVSAGADAIAFSGIVGTQDMFQVSAGDGTIYVVRTNTAEVKIVHFDPTKELYSFVLLPNEEIKQFLGRCAARDHALAIMRNLLGEQGAAV